MTPLEVRFRQVMPSPKKKTPRTSADSDEQIAFADAAAFDGWLKSNHASRPGVWLRIAKKGSARKTVSYQEAIDVALAWGWIDALKRPLDAAEWLQRFTPRGPRSPWSKINWPCSPGAKSFTELNPRTSSTLGERARARRSSRPGRKSRAARSPPGWRRAALVAQ